VSVAARRLRPLERILTVAVALASGTAGIRAECVGFSTSHNLQRADLVFSGTVTSVQQLDDRHELVTLNVEKVWKGPAGRRVILHDSLESIDSYRFPVDAIGQQYLVFADRLTSQQQAGFRLGEKEQAFGVPICGGGTGPLPQREREVRDLGRNRAPR